jgi:hypothetical protein
VDTMRIVSSPSVFLLQVELLDYKKKTPLFQTFDAVLCPTACVHILPTIGSASQTPTSIKKLHHPAVQGPGS